MNITLEEKNLTMGEPTQPQWLMNPSLYLNDHLCVSHLVFASIGIPLNLCVITFVIALKRLHLKRTFTWLGIGFSNVFLFIAHLAEARAVYWPSPSSDQLCALFSGLPYLTILLSHFVSFLERHFCLKHPNWYKRHITSCWIVLSAHFGSFVVLCLIIKGRHLFQPFPFLWQLGTSELTAGICIPLTTFALCFFAQMTLWAISRWTYPSTRVVNIALWSFNSIGNVEEGPPQVAAAENGTSSDAETVSPFVEIDGERISRLDVEAARVLTFNGLIVLLFFIPPFLSLFHLVGCFQLIGEELIKCSANTAQLMYYLRELVSIPCSFISPISFFFQIRDIRSALRDKRWC